jgi:serine/threonine-protein kinase HipA
VLAPFYDLASSLPYDTIDPKRARLAMKIGGEDRLRNMVLPRWEKCAVDLRLDVDLRHDKDALLGRILIMALEPPDQATTVLEKMKADGLSHPTVTKLAEGLKARATACLQILEF